AQVMTRDVLTIEHKDTIYDAALMLSENEFHALPVMDEDELVGIVTTTDLVKFLLKLF
ncbi:MAG: CBS domain-containing protein, partial [Flavobacteriaceae bacterium]|nr:CBS domain-containing protein [Flavobacteriaceae bacterium]